MPIISRIGRRSWKVRAVYALIYTILIVGALSMIYPLLLMISGSVRTPADFNERSPWPTFTARDEVLWRDYCQSRYGSIARAEQAFRRTIGSWQNLQLPSADNDRLVLEYREFRSQKDLPFYWYKLGQEEFKELLTKNARLFRKAMQDLYGDDLESYSRDAGVRYQNWSQIGPPMRELEFAQRVFTFPKLKSFERYYSFKASADTWNRTLVDLDGMFWQTQLLPQWPTIDAYNTAHGTSLSDYRQLVLSRRAPQNIAQRRDWEQFVRIHLNVAFIRIDESALAAFESFVRKRRGTNDWILPPLDVMTDERLRGDVEAFIRDPRVCPLDVLSIEGPRQTFERFVAAKRVVPVESVEPLAFPTEAADFADFQEHKRAIRWEFLTRNYRYVLDYLLLHGNGIRNTAILCALMVLTQLIVNPLAAYALSRFRLPSTYSILLFCMATMAFPAEVTMIPSFLLLKNLGLLNTFWALVLPAAANGFSIFLLKGFFDSLPRDLYEAADIDGASEFTKFRVITMSLSKPILAVLALGAFTAAYSEFMMALVIIPDPKMWTMMVWLFQLQAESHGSVVYASLVIASIPTLIIFLLSQNVIMRGIVVPTEK